VYIIITYLFVSATILHPKKGNVKEIFKETPRNTSRGVIKPGAGAPRASKATRADW
jgi:hypothetical protein